MVRPGGLLKFGAGGAIGLLVGLIAGLSVSPVTSTILGALSAGLLVLLGFKDSKGGDNSQGHALKVLGFGLFCSIALVLGISLRTHQVLSPSLETQKKRLMAVKVFTPDDISAILLSTNFGLVPIRKSDAEEGVKSVYNDKRNSTNVHGEAKAPVNTQPVSGVASADLAYAGLLRAGSTEFCQIARREQFRDVRAYLDALKIKDPGLAHVIESVPESDRDALSYSLSEYICP